MLVPGATVTGSNRPICATGACPPQNPAPTSGRGEGTVVAVTVENTCVFTWPAESDSVSSTSYSPATSGTKLGDATVAEVNRAMLPGGSVAKLHW